MQTGVKLGHSVHCGKAKPCNCNLTKPGSSSAPSQSKGSQRHWCFCLYHIIKVSNYWPYNFLKSNHSSQPKFDPILQKKTPRVNSSCCSSILVFILFHHFSVYWSLCLWVVRVELILIGFGICPRVGGAYFWVCLSGHWSVTVGTRPGLSPLPVWLWLPGFASGASRTR